MLNSSYCQTAIIWGSSSLNGSWLSYLVAEVEVEVLAAVAHVVHACPRPSLPSLAVLIQHILAAVVPDWE